MSATEFYLNKGYTPVFRHRDLSGVGTATVWTPTTSTRIVVTNLAISSNLGGTIAFYWGNSGGPALSPENKLFDFALGSSANIFPAIHLESTYYDRILTANVSGGGTNGWKVTAVGFEIP